MDRPKFCDEEHLEYLDDLRESGETNMFGASSWLRDEYPDLTRQEARNILSYWMETFNKVKR